MRSTLLNYVKLDMRSRVQFLNLLLKLTNAPDRAVDGFEAVCHDAGPFVLLSLGDSLAHRLVDH